VQVKSLGDDGSFVAVVDGHHVHGTVVVSAEATHLFIPTGMEAHGVATQFTLGTPVAAHGDVGEGSGAPTVVTPMPGKVVKVLAAEGDFVVAGQPVVILEAMKMEHVINAPITGKLVSLKFAEGEQVGSGDVLAEFEAVAEE
jgi:biotin carboxyl carrier protein